ncbi:hypothetical protein LUZ60_005611 [Juncus effusus]|nr:hypothetical protein LUZ60_005611 [Juncus effusus]
MAATSHSQFFLLSPLKNKPSANSSLSLKTLHSKRHFPPPQISLSAHETSQTTTTNPSSQNPPIQPRKTSIWINPKGKLMSFSDERMTRLKTLAASLDQSKPPDGTVASILSAQTFPISEADAVRVLDTMKRSDKALLALRWFLKNIEIRNEIILYNVTFKNFRKSKDWNRTESLFSELLQSGVEPDIITFTTIISSAKQCNLPSKAVEFFEKMSDFNLQPSNLTRASIIGSYFHSGQSDKALQLYDQIRTEKDGYQVAFVTMIKNYARAGNYDGALNVFEEMRALEIKPNLIIYNCLLDAMKHANRPWQVKTIYKEMLKNNFEPDRTTFVTLIRSFSKARYAKDALNIYQQMKEQNIRLDTMLYNHLLSMCADLGLLEETEQLFEEMKNLPEGSRPDSWTFSSVLTAYSCSGRVSDAERVFNEMLNAGFKPDIFLFTSLVQCYGVAKRVGEVKRVVDKIAELAVKTDDRFSACLLNVATHNCDGTKEDFDVILECISSVNLKLGELVNFLVLEDQSENNSDELIKERINEWLETVLGPVRKPCLNCLLDICMNFGKIKTARVILDYAIELKIYDGLHEKFQNMWVLKLRSLSIGGAKVAFNAWTEDLKAALKSGEKIPVLVGINTGHGNHKYGGKRLINELKVYLGEINAPFHEDSERGGWLVSTDVAVQDWLETERLL